ncbi:FkbM family methyltransferase [Pelagibius litoralis]|uniref:FkbM family methyltransferase n=1 Tax=Pelagibius litoralis TaxID=374515 RepID=A0A967CCJ0_9PROT|nr:FkbM family methyltransferase [Pelagibius litoralis]NIA69074.1 FkbM family methyltransferase [Pelagibius litoralis]
MTLFSRVKRLLNRLQRRPALSSQGSAMDAFLQAAARLGPGDIAIDCGANVGRFTLPLARSGATVYAFEPNPDAFDRLSQDLAAFDNVQLHQKAVAEAAGTMKLYLHEFAEDDPLKWSTGSSLLAFKGNVREDTFVSVEVVDLAAFMAQLDKPVALLKMDIEGAEVAVLERLLERGLENRIGQAFVEVHDRKMPELAERTNRLRALLRKRGLTNFDLNWH